MVALPKVELGEQPPVVGVGHQVLGHQRRKLDTPQNAASACPIASSNTSAIPPSRTTGGTR